MKRSYVLSMALLLGISASAEELTLVGLTGKDMPGAPEEMHIGTNALAISPDGKYLCGVIENAAGIFISDWKNNSTKWMLANDDSGAELRNVNNNGDAVGFDGPGIIYSFSTGQQTELNAPEGMEYVIGQALTNDGSIIAGSIVAESFKTLAAVKKGDADWQLLPIPSDEELGAAYAAEAVYGSGVQCISGDGKVIYGFLGNLSIPMLWIMNEEGEYEPEMFLKPYTKFTEDDIADESKPLWNATKMAMYSLSLSNNGKYLTLRGVIGESIDNNQAVPMMYDIENKELTIYEGDQPIDESDWGLYPTAISNDGTFIGTIGQPMTNSAGSFIMEKGESVAKTYNSVFPEYAEVLGEGDSYGFYVPTGISATGRYLTGYGFYVGDYMDAASDEYYISYVIDRGEEYDLSGVNEIASESTEATPVSIYTIDGKQVNSPVKGINIIRMSDGTARKVMVK